FFASRRRHTRSYGDWSSDVCSSDLLPQSTWAERQMRAHANAVENLVIFAPLVLVAHALSISTGATVFACALYFWARLAHYIIYKIGRASCRERVQVRAHGARRGSKP